MLEEKSGHVFSYKLRYIVGFRATNPKPTVCSSLYENKVPDSLFLSNRRLHFIHIKM